MTKKKNRFFLFCTSLIPGAGEMYLGFMKQGISLMLLFFSLFLTADYLSFYPLYYLTPIVWFYSFFHVHNLHSLPDEEFYAVEDDFLVQMEPTHIHSERWLKNNHKIAAFVLIFFGISILWNNLLMFLIRILDILPISSSVYNLIMAFSRSIPQIVIACGIIAIGVNLIKGKKEELDFEEKEKPEYIITPKLEDRENN